MATPTIAEFAQLRNEMDKQGLDPSQQSPIVLNIEDYTQLMQECRHYNVLSKHSGGEFIMGIPIKVG